MKKLIISLIVLVLLAGAGAAAYYYKYGKPVEPEISTLPVTRGDIIQKVGGTGTIESVITVKVGTQVNGIIKELNTDFNDIVKKGQLLAKIDPATIEAKIQQDQAQLESAMANLDRQKVALEDARNKLRRADDLFKRNLVTQQDLETAQVNFKTAEVQIRSQEASITQVKATLNQDQVNLGYTDIYAPIDGIVTNRLVDIGQTVVSNNSATPMFEIAADLTQMQVKANIDESDVGLIRPGQRTTFTVDAFLGQQFIGTVDQVRLQPTVQQNVVTYIVIISVPNPDLKLRPGMTAQVNIEIARRENVLRIPNAAIRFRPTEEIFTALKQEMPPELRRGQGGRGQGQAGARGMNAMGGGQGQAAPSGAAANVAGSPGSARGEAAVQRGGGDRQGQQAAERQTGMQGRGEGQQARGQQSQGQSPQGQGQQGQWQGRQGGQGGERGQGGGFGGQNMTPEERQKRMQERLAQMTPEERAQFEARMKERGIDPNNPQFGMGGGRGQGPGGQAQGGGTRGQGQGGMRGQQQATPSTPAVGTARMTPLARALAGSAGPNSMFSRGAATIDALFGPLPSTETRGRVWTATADKKLKLINGLRLGITDGTFTELIEGPVDENAKLVSGVDTGNGTSSRPNATNPFGMPGGRGGPMPGMGGPGGGRGR
ncbi:MAG: efflux RND transporter periplasmic adaptor subunit [Bacteroidales bacterium]